MNAWLTWEPSPLAAWATLALLIAGALAARQYFRAGAPQPLLLRLAALGLLAVMAWQPSLRFVERSDARRPLRIIVDDSLSMNLIDSGRSPGEWLRVATSLGRFDTSAQVSPLRDLEHLQVALTDLRHANEALTAARQGDPIATAERERLAVATAATARAASALRASAESVGCAPETLASLDHVEQAIAESTEVSGVELILNEAVPDLRKQARIDDDETAIDNAAAADAVRQTRSMTRFGLAVAAARRLRTMHPAEVKISSLSGPLPTEPEAAASPLSAALRDACVRAAAEKSEAVVLISDGRATETRSLLASAAAVGVPVYTVAAAPDDRSPDVRVTRIEARPAVLEGQSVLVRARVSQRNAAGQKVILTLTDGKDATTRPVTLGNDNTFELTWPTVASPGVRLTARVDGVNGESQTGNNSQSTYVTAFRRKQRVLLIAGPGGRDVGDLAAALGGSPWIDLKRPRFQKTDRTPVELPDAELTEADLIVLADIPPAILSDAAWAGLTKAVRDRGCSLLVMAGTGDWLADPDVARRLAPLLPTTPGPRPSWAIQPVWTVPSRFGTDAFFLRLDESADASFRAWLGRPKLSRLLAVGPPAVGARALLVDRSTQSPVLLDAAAGGGRVALVLTDEIWRWNETDEEAAKRFWLGLADAMDDLPYAAEQDGLSIAVDRVDATAGRTLFARARAADPGAGIVTCTVTSGGQTYGPPPVRELMPGGGRYVIPLNLPAGQFDVVLHQGTRSVRTTLTVTADAQQELADTTPDAGFLRRAADATGGTALTLEDIGRLPELLVRQREREERLGTYAIWSSPYAFALVVACLGLEWAIRPRARLA